MKSKVLLVIVASLLLFHPFSLLGAVAQEDRGLPPGGSLEGQMPDISLEQDEVVPAQLCTADNMRIMLQNAANKQCVADSVLQDQATTEIIMNRIVADPDLRKQMMEKMHAEMHKRMMEMQQQHGGQGAMKGGAGGMEQQEGTMQGHGGTTGGREGTTKPDETRSNQ